MTERDVPTPNEPYPDTPKPEDTALTTTERPFLTARWEHLVLVNYTVAPERLTPFLPPGIELDLLDGDAHMSLVAFDFLDTRVLGIPFPGYRHFPEINLRFYVREGERRGVCFIREYVPKRLIAWVARLLYNEPYVRAPMTSSVELLAERRVVNHQLRAGGRVHSLSVTAKASSTMPSEDSEAHFFKEHSWGYGTDRRGRCVRYEVRHPVWETYAVESFKLNWDWGAVYGPEWADYASIAPRSVFLAHGSAISVSPRND